MKKRREGGYKGLRNPNPPTELQRPKIRVQPRRVSEEVERLREALTDAGIPDLPSQADRVQLLITQRDAARGACNRLREALAKAVKLQQGTRHE